MTDSKDRVAAELPTGDSRSLAARVQGTGRRVVLVHGFTQSKSSWSVIADQLGKLYEVIAIDLPDHGDSGEIRASSLEDAADLVGRTGGPASYVGYSLGGRVCLTLALRHPELIESLVLVGATPGIVADSDRAARVTADHALADRLDPPGAPGSGLDLDDFLTEWLAGPLFAHLTNDQADLSSRRVNTTAGLARSLRTTGTGTQIPSHDRLHELSMPVLLVAGANDARFSAIASEMKGAIGPNASTSFIEGAGHAAPFEQPREFAAVVARFLAEH
jgi:2-succinyl-6-hydroxy-2,4-cyclohexadiene-1-carboxylate synthase